MLSIFRRNRFPDCILIYSTAYLTSPLKWLMEISYFTSLKVNSKSSHPNLLLCYCPCHSKRQVHFAVVWAPTLALFLILLLSYFHCNSGQLFLQNISRICLLPATPTALTLAQATIISSLSFQETGLSFCAWHLEAYSPNSRVIVLEYDRMPLLCSPYLDLILIWE